MASARIPDELFDTVAHHLPWSSPMGPKGRWLQIGHRVVIGAIWIRAHHRCQVAERPAGTGVL